MSFITWVSLGGLALGVLALITVLSVMNGFESELRNRLLSLSAHATLTAPEGAPITGWRDRLRELKGAPSLVGAAPFLDTDAMLSHPPAMGGAIVRGIDPALEPGVSTISGAMREGKLEALEPGMNRIVLGRMLAYQLQVGVGDTVTVMIPDSAGGDSIVPRLENFEVAGIFEVGLEEQDSVLALINLQDAEALRGVGGPTGIRLKFTDVLKAPQLAREAAARLPAGLIVRDWTQENEAYFRAIRIEKTMMGLILMLIVAVAVFNIVATLVMVVSDKRTDIAILRTLGMTPRGILGVFMTQGLLIGWLGTLIGVVLGVALALHVGEVAQVIEHLFGVHIMDDPDVYYTTGLPSEMHPGDVIKIAAAAMLLSLIATVYPSWKASKTQPAEALRYE
ncbi:MAG TPA: lipoprotein-releasing ABC transporter permease subunit [Steroidobacteraceae bacterium]|nr:lipoprotein-releasing ABC transporter permease subunit [Steroidobacteraceae bacterium]